jgi:hypothetical protein
VVFWAVRLCRPVNGYKGFGGIFCFHLKGWNERFVVIAHACLCIKNDVLTSRLALAVMLVICIWEVPDSGLGWDKFNDFPKSLQTNSGTVLLINHDHVILRAFKFIIPISSSCIILTISSTAKWNVFLYLFLISSYQ